MKIILLIYLITASRNCFDDKGIDLYNKYSGQGPNRYKGSDLSSYMASPVSQNILQGNSSMIPGQNSGCADQKQMYYMQGRVPYSQGGLINSLMGQPLNQRVFTSSCGRKSEEEKYRDCVQKQIQEIKKMVMTCKSIYGEDSNLCCVDGGCLQEINDLNFTTKTGIPCLDAMTYTGLGPAPNTMQSAMFTSNRSSFNPYASRYSGDDCPSGGYQGGGYQGGGYQGGGYQGGSYQGGGYQKEGYQGGGYQGGSFQGMNYQDGSGYQCGTNYPSNFNSNMMGSGGSASSCSSGGNNLCDPIPQSFCNMMKGPVLGMKTYKKCSYQGDIVNINDWCKKDDCKDGCPRQNDCKNSISGPSGCSTNSNFSSNVLPKQSSNMYFNQYGIPMQQGGMYGPTQYGMPMQQGGMYGPTQYGMPMQQGGMCGPNQYGSPMQYGSFSSQQPNLMYPTQTTQTYNYKPGKKYKKSNKYTNRIPFDGIILIEPNTSLHNYITNIISDPNRIGFVGDKSYKNRSNSRSSSSSLKESTPQESSSTNEEEDKKTSPKKKKKKSEDDDSSDTQNVFQDVGEDSTTKNKEDPRFDQLKEKCAELSKKDKGKKIKGCAKLLETEEE